MEEVVSEISADGRCEIRLRRVKYWASPNVKYSAAAECDDYYRTAGTAPVSFRA